MQPPLPAISPLIIPPPLSPSASPSIQPLLPPSSPQYQRSSGGLGWDRRMEKTHLTVRNSSDKAEARQEHPQTPGNRFYISVSAVDSGVIIAPRKSVTRLIRTVKWGFKVTHIAFLSRNKINGGKSRAVSTSSYYNKHMSTVENYLCFLLQLKLIISAQMTCLLCRFTLFYLDGSLS